MNYKVIVSKYIEIYNLKFSKDLKVRPEVENFNLISLNFDFECLDKVITYYDTKAPESEKEEVWKEKYVEEIYDLLKKKHNKANLFKTNETSGYSSYNEEIKIDEIPSILNYI